MHRGAYTPVSRAVARILVKAGCSYDHIGSVIAKVCKAAGIEVKGKMSRRTASRCVGEGGIAAKLQIGYEMAHTDSKPLVFFQLKLQIL